MLLLRNRLLQCRHLRENHAVSVEPKTDIRLSKHIPVLLNEVVESMAPALDKIPEPSVIDMTFGCGGHTSAILKRWPKTQMFCLDRDPNAHERCKAMKHPQITPLLGRFRDIPALLGQREAQIDAILFDLGVSSPQLDNNERGFSLSADAPLDMRMDGERISDQPTASDVVNQLPVADLAKIIKTYGEERNAEEIARAIVDFRNSRGHITRTAQLASIIQACCGGKESRDKLGRFAHPATRTFQALRIFVNDELNDLYHGLEAAAKLLKPSGRCLLISFHSLEDRIAKRLFHAVDIKTPAGIDDVDLHSRLRTSNEPLSPSQMAALMSRKWKPIAGKNLSSTKAGNGFHNSVVVPSQAESEANPRARSAKLRVAEKL